MNNQTITNSGIRFNGQHSFENFEFWFSKAPNLGMPSKVKNEKRATLSNYTFDFSALYGHQVFTDRPLEFYFQIFEPKVHDASEIQFRKTQAVNWLMSTTGRQRLTVDILPGYYFMAEVVNAPSFTFNDKKGELTVSFIAYPFMIDLIPEYQNIYWNDFRFATDVLQEYKFKVSANKEINIINAGTSHIIPTIDSTANCTILLRGDVINIQAGTRSYNDLVLAPGENKMFVTGNTTIEYQYNKELI